MSVEWCLLFFFRCFLHEEGGATLVGHAGQHGCAGSRGQVLDSGCPERNGGMPLWERWGEAGAVSVAVAGAGGLEGEPH